MNKATIRNALVVIGAWVLSSLIAFSITALLIPINYRLTYTGDTGTVAMWLWEGFPEALAAALAAIAVVWATETRKPMVWVSLLAGLYVYSGILQAFRLITQGWHTPPRRSDYVGILAQAIIPVVVCVIVGVWRTKHSSPPKLAAT